VFGSIKRCPVRLDFIVDPATDLKAVLLFGLRTKRKRGSRPIGVAYP